MFRVFVMINVAYGLLNLWVLWWFWGALQSNKKLRLFLFPMLAVLAFSFTFLYRRVGGEGPAVMLLYAGLIWVGGFAYVLLMIWALEIYVFINRKRNNISKHAEVFKRLRYRSAFVILSIAALVILIGGLNAAHPILREVDLTIRVNVDDNKTLPRDTLTVAMVADMHLGRLIPWQRMANALALLKPHNPHAIFFLGDIIDDYVFVNPYPVANILSELNPELGAWAIIGNHEYIAGDVYNSINIFRASGMNVIRDGWVILDDAFLIVGRDDVSKRRFTGRERASIPEIIKDVPQVFRQLPMIILDHNPIRLEEAEGVGAALQLSGHTHNGQILPINLITNKIYENPYGHSVRGNTHYFVTQGTGVWGPPVRTTGRSEIVLLRLRFVPQ